MPKVLPTLRTQDGFTLVEVCAAIIILLIGVMGVLTMATGASTATSRTRAHEAANGLGRDMVEATHSLPYATLTGARLTSTLQSRPGLADTEPATAGWQVVRRGVTYTVVVNLCDLDDPKDGVGVHGASFCSDTGAAGTADVSPNDYKRVSFTLTWRRNGGSDRMTQATLIMNSDRGPTVTALNTSPPGNPGVTAGSSVSFALTTSSAPTKVEWYLDNAFQQDLGGGISGSGTAYSFSWSLGISCTSNSVGDGTYVVSARAFNSSASTPGPRALTVQINRCVAQAPTALAGGRNRWGVELNWEDNREDDVIGYRIYRGIGSATPTAIASGPCSGVVKVSTCVEPDPSPSQALVYNVRAVDRDVYGAQRNGAVSANYTVITGNRAPATPTIGSAGTYGTLGWYAVTDPDSNDSVDFYRIYRDGQAFANRYDVIDAVGSPLLWTDSNPGGAQHTYYVVAVDTRLAESGFSNVVTR